MNNCYKIKKRVANHSFSFILPGVFHSLLEYLVIVLNLMICIYSKIRMLVEKCTIKIVIQK